MCHLLDEEMAIVGSSGASIDSQVEGEWWIEWWVEVGTHWIMCAMHEGMWGSMCIRSDYTTL